MTGDQQPSGPPTTLEQRLNIDFALQAAGLGIWEYDPVLNQVLWDQRCRALFGLSANNRMSYEQAFNHIHPDDIARVDQAARWVLNPHSDGLFDQTYRTIGVDDGKLRWVRFQGRVDLKPSGEIHHFGGIAQDVTQQMLTQLALETSRQRILNSFEHAPFAVAVLIGPELTYLMTNALYCKLVGRTADQLVGKPMTEAIPEVKGQGFVELLQQVISTGTPYEAKQTAFQIHLPDDGVKTAYFDFTYQPWQENDQVIGVMIAASDVTQQVKAQQQVEESQSQLRDVIAETPFAMGLHVGADLRIEVANDTQLNYWGRDRSVIGKSFREVLPELEGQGFFELFEQAYATGQSFQGSAAQAQLSLNGKLGTYYFDYSFKPVRNKQGQVYAVLNTAIDVTETVRARHMVDDARQELLEANQRLSLAMDAGQLGAYTLDLATGTMDVSAQCRANYGQPDDTPFNFPELMATIIADDREWVQQAINTAVETQIIYVAEYQIVWPDDTRHWVRASGQPEYGPAGQPLRIIGVTQDITAQRLMQEELGRQVQQRTAQLQASVRDLRRSNENLQQFAYIASHDLQEPLRKIQQFGDLLKTRFADSLGGEELVYLERMQGAASRMSTLVKDLLSFSRISIEQSGDDAVDLNQVIDEVVGVLDMAIANSNAYVQVEMLPTILGDFVQLRQLFQNLISNALKFHRLDTAPHIRISSQMLETTELPPTVKPGRLSTHYVRIDVADNGIGFDEKYLDRIFQVFQRLHGRSQYAGTGVGLAICEKVVTNHGGAITASSQPGQGATFSVYLPA